MSNTIIQIKRSTTSSEPASLHSAELGYSYSSNTIFIGTPDGTGTIAIGGRRYLEIQNTIFTLSNAAFDKANSANLLAYNTGIGANNYTNTSTTASNTYAGLMANAANSYAGAMANSANAHANYVGILANDYANLVGTSANSYAAQVGQASNVYADGVGVSANAYSDVSSMAANNYAGAMANAANAYAQSIGLSGNVYVNTSTSAANNYAGAMANSVNAYTLATYVKLTAASQTITGDFSITGNLFIGGNTTAVSANNLIVNDPLIYLANNNPSDTLDIGFVGSYTNTGSAHVHTGLYRDHTSKQYYLFQGYDANPNISNEITPYSNNMVNATLVADFVTSNLTLGGANAIVWIRAAYDKANAANVLAYNTGIGANGYTVTVGDSANNYAGAMANAANAYSVTIGNSANNYAGAMANAANAYAASVGASANAHADAVGSAANTNAANGSYISSGIVKVPYGGTGMTSFTSNGILYGNTSGDLKVTSAGTEGQVLQADASGVPLFGMLDGGSF